MAGRILDRAVIGALEGCCRQLWGFSPRMIASIVESKGAGPALAWFMVNMPRYLLTMHVLGPIRTHLACAAISLHNGCVYCAYGQAYALELLYLRDRDRLFPLDVRTLADWIDLEPRRLAVQLLVVLQEAGLQEEIAWVDVTLAIADGTQLPIDRDEVRIAHLVTMISEMNRIATGAGVAPDGAHDSVNKDAVLRARHADLRRLAPG